MVEVIEAPKTVEQLSAELVAAHKKQDWKSVSKLASAIAKLQAEKDQAEKDAKVKALEAITLEVKAAIDKAVQKFVDNGKLDVADGVWYSHDFGEKLTTCKLMKSAPKAKRGEGKGSGGYVAVNIPTKELLTKVGSQVMFPADTIVTIDKTEHTMKAGTTFQQAFDFSSNGGWRNRVVMGIRKAAGVV